jgi:hypothetical protein
MPRPAKRMKASTISVARRSESEPDLREVVDHLSKIHLIETSRKLRTVWLVLALEECTKFKECDHKYAPNAPANVDRRRRSSPEARKAGLVLEVLPHAIDP